MRNKPLAMVPLVIMALAACAWGPTPPRASSDAVGDYTLITVKGAPLPFPLGVAPGYKLEYTSGTLTLRADRTYVQRNLMTQTIQSTTGPRISVDTTEATGRWTQPVDTLVVLVANGRSEQFEAVVKNQSLSFDVPAGDSTYTFVYWKQ